MTFLPSPAGTGIGGSMHMYNAENHFYGGCGIVGAQIPLGAGLGLAHQYKKDGSVAITMYGDGAANQGQKYEALNMAGLWALPVIFVCENNHYGELGPWQELHGCVLLQLDPGNASAALRTRPTGCVLSSAAFTVRLHRAFLEGQHLQRPQSLSAGVLGRSSHPSLVETRGLVAVKFAKTYALANGPIILEMDTYRYHGHSMSDPGSTYRTRDEVNSMRQERDPIERVRKLLQKHEIDPAELKRVEKEVKREVDEAVESSKVGPIPPDSWLWRNVYADPKNSQLRQVDGTYIAPTHTLDYSV
ncbi:MAG: hypothetical protein WDW38_011491 [Sanguina aurantia]